ncbi:hypothetical protein [Pseudogemmobacter sp. W21_MBD1_M6]|uniref:hypothetical protein n=1 Tax=Pseudogemmobacter sp. W21_MBD1_M6 TaxID=3240271 RepID=UPI003F97DC3C
MFAKKPVGRGASVIKYDLLTAMGAYALSLDKGPQRLILRLMTLVTARYNWGRNELTVGQREIARLWGVDERTVKREIAKLKTMGWLIVKRQGARGRVAEYGLDLTCILHNTKPRWAAVGPDFEDRMDHTDEPDSKVVPMPLRGAGPPPDISDGTEWAQARARLYDEDPGRYRSWVEALIRIERAGGQVQLLAPSRFHATYVTTHMLSRLLRACQAVDPTVTVVVVGA